MNLDACLQETARTLEALPAIRPQIDRAGDLILGDRHRNSRCTDYDTSTDPMKRWPAQDHRTIL